MIEIFGYWSCKNHLIFFHALPIILLVNSNTLNFKILSEFVPKREVYFGDIDSHINFFLKKIQVSTYTILYRNHPFSQSTTISLLFMINPASETPTLAHRTVVSHVCSFGQWVPHLLLQQMVPHTRSSVCGPTRRPHTFSFGLWAPTPAHSASGPSYLLIQPVESPHPLI